MTFGEKALQFYSQLRAPRGLPPGIVTMNPYRKPAVMGYVQAFLAKFYGDTRSRVLVFGINPGRFGAGLTGVMFTDPVALEAFCAIPNDLEKRRELSSVFIYAFAEHWGGVQSLYKEFFLTALSPLGFTRDGLNFNFYDDPACLAAIRPFLVSAIRAQVEFGADRGAAIVLGTGRNKSIFEQLNAEHGLFKRVYALEHPRFIMQYRRKRLEEYLRKYTAVFSEARS